MRDLSQYEGVQPMMRTGDLVEWQSNGLIGRGIMSVTGRQVSHSSLVVLLPYQGSARRYVIEAIRTGLEFHLLSDNLRHYDGKAWWYRLKPQYDCKRDVIGTWAFDKLSQGVGYDFGGVLGQLFGRVSLDAGRYFCSELVDDAYIRAGVIMPDPAGARRPGDFTPLDIFDAQAPILE